VPRVVLGGVDEADHLAGLLGHRDEAARLVGDHALEVLLVRLGLVGELHHPRQRGRVGGV
jgi:hypothetical protein